MNQQELSYSAEDNSFSFIVKWYNHFERQFDNFLNILLGIYPKDVKNYVHTKTCTEMFKNHYDIVKKLASN